MATVFPTLLWAEGEGYPEPSRDIRFSLSVTPTYQFPAHVDGGGKLSVVKESEQRGDLGFLACLEVVSTYGLCLPLGLPLAISAGLALT
jgi:hypothetical protein